MGLLALVGVLAALVVIAAVLPASLARRFLPPAVSVEDFSGTIWHGSAGHVRVLGREAGALEWELHPAALLHLALDARLHWVQQSFVLDALLEASSGRLRLSNVEGGGPIEDLHGLGLPPGCAGLAQINLRELEARLTAQQLEPVSLAGTVLVSGLVWPPLGDHADLGAYRLEVPATGPGAGSGAADPGEISGRLTDAGGGPLGLEADLHYAPSTHLGTLSGTVVRRGPLPPGLERGLNDIAAMHAPDPQGRIPLDLEFTL